LNVDIDLTKDDHRCFQALLFCNRARSLADSNTSATLWTLDVAIRLESEDSHFFRTCGSVASAALPQRSLCVGSDGSVDAALAGSSGEGGGCKTGDVDSDAADVERTDRVWCGAWFDGEAVDTVDAVEEPAGSPSCTGRPASDDPGTVKSVAVCGGERSDRNKALIGLLRRPS